MSFLAPRPTCLKGCLHLINLSMSRELAGPSDALLVFQVGTLRLPEGGTWESLHDQSRSGPDPGTNGSRSRQFRRAWRVTHSPQP